MHFSTDPENLPIFESGRKSWKPVAVVKEAVRGLVDVLQYIGNVVIYFVIFVPVWLLIAAVIWLIKKYLPTIKQNNN